MNSVASDGKTKTHVHLARLASKGFASLPVRMYVAKENYHAAPTVKSGPVTRTPMAVSCGLHWIPALKEQSVREAIASLSSNPSLPPLKWLSK
jgi:hypothetical protein